MTPAAAGPRLRSGRFDDLAGREVHGAYWGIALPNAPSVALHRKLGFRPVGVPEEVGKFCRYRDVEWYERRIAGGVDGVR